jgi:hypothetical protein
LSEIDIEWMQTTHLLCPVPLPKSSTPSYKLIVEDVEKNQAVENVSLPNQCINAKTWKQKLAFNENGKITSCNANSFVFGTTLRPCAKYSVHVFRFEKEKSTLCFRKSFVIRTLKPGGNNY